ncbi:hypothetical protein [Candidatus Xianfuyuplasma coldseepsis]|uniref:Uncharacterized protein n=1 Tax=Candidatus Xianfuyuplasma coldseepsis TaxID=2782163 RepID=A0A7L7KSQ8_9MOLU|nr:hypothetical protein [Xianfuyuplasma coldseepsis]QMS85851.1 hypothetical protein G4Z02_08860 [Xianfuyuplasma coldseepsis]
MKENILKTYDIASYDIELDFQKQIAPIEKAIQKLNSSHETKSLKAHKDFLVKEKKSTSVINQLQEKSLLKNQRIERAVENKLKKISGREPRYKEELQNYIDERTAAANEQKAVIDEAIKELQLEEQQLIDEIKIKFKTNIESYVEKLDIYNNNFENNKQRHHEQIDEYQQDINKQIEKIEEFYHTTINDLSNRVQAFFDEKEQDDKAIQSTLTKASRMLSTQATNTRKTANQQIANINEYVDSLKIEYSNHYEPKIDIIDQRIADLKEQFEARTQLVNVDLDINIKKLEDQLTELEESDKKARRNIMAKIDLFQMRASTTLQYEERLLHQEVRVLKNERELIENSLLFEQDNLEKLRVFLLNDQKNLKETGDYFRDLNIVLKEQLNEFELTNNEYIYKHEQLKADFITQYTNIFHNLKKSTIEMTQTYLEKIADNNYLIDDINKFLDTADPLKEIEVNRLRENIEINEVQERYKIKFAKQEYEKEIIDNELAFDIAMQEIKTKELLSEYHKDVADIRNKEVYDKALEKAKLKHSKAEEVYKLRLNNTKLERRLLDSKYKTEQSILEENKKLVAIDIRKHNALRIKEIEYAIKNLKIESDYKVEVIQKALEEDLLKLEEQASKAKYEKDAYAANLHLEIETKTTEFNKQKNALENEAQKRIHLIDEALNRELREPMKNKIKTEAIVDERLSKLDTNNAIFVDFITDIIASYQDDKLSVEQIREIILSSDSLQEKASKYLSRTYEVLTDAMQFMSDIEQANHHNKIAATSDQGQIKKYNRLIEKAQSDLTRELNAVHTSEQDHKTVIRLLIEQEMNTIKQANVDSLDELTQITETAYHKIFSKLQDIQKQLRTSITELYQPLSQHDQQLIDHANSNADKAKQQVLDKLQQDFIPIDEALEAFKQQKQAEQQEFIDQLDQQINEFRNQINHLKNEALEQTKAIHQEQEDIINQKQLSKQEIEASEERFIVIEQEKIDNEIKQLQATYEEALQQLEVKDAEAKKIFDYEDRIHTIAVESATARYNDATVKTNNVHLNNMKQYQNSVEQATQVKDRNEHKYNQELLDLTNQFEKNIFTTRPRLEESIGDAQKQIDQQIAEKTEQLHDLQTNNQNIITSASNALYTAFQEGYDRLSDNLQNYIEKYRLIEQDFIAKNDHSNDLISANNQTFNNSLFELSKTKHEETLEELLSINATMYGKEEF